MSIDHLVKMANDIGDFFDSQPGDDAAQIALHLRRYWEPRMRRQIIAYVRGGGDGLRSTAREAVLRLADEAEANQPG